MNTACPSPPRRTQQCRRRVLGNDHPQTLRTAHILAATQRKLGWYEQAYQLGQDTLTRCRRVLGDDHPHTLRTAHNLAATQQTLGQHKQPRSTESMKQIACRA